MENVIKTYPNGLRTVVRQMPGFNSISSRIQINVGSIDEAENEHGLSHFLEHLMFYTKSRSAKDVRDEIKDCSARINGCTYKIRTVYFTFGLDFNFDKCNEILADMFFNTNITKENLEKEKQIVIQEIERETKPDNEKNPDTLMYEYYYSGTPFEHKTGGTVESVQKFSVKDVINFKKKHYIAPNIILGFAGNISPERVDKMVEELWLPHLDKTAAKPKYAVINDKKMYIPKRKFIHIEKDVSQHRVSISIPSINYYSPDYYKLNLIVNLLDKYLFDIVREELGLVYNISSNLALTKISGRVNIDFECDPKNTKKVLTIIMESFEKLKNNDISENEVDRIKKSFIATQLFDSEDVAYINNRNIDLLALDNEIIPNNKINETYDSITISDLHETAKKYLKPKKAIIVIVGKNAKDVKPFEILK